MNPTIVSHSSRMCLAWLGRDYIDVNKPTCKICQKKGRK